MNRLACLICGIVLLMSAFTVVAQRRGGRGASEGRPLAGTSSPDDTSGFKRAVALQATPEQMAQFHRLTKSAEAARKSAQDILQVSKTASQPDLSHYANPLSNAMEEILSDNEKFLQSFSTIQKSGLKSVTKKLGKTNFEVTKQSKALTRRLGRPGINGKQLTLVAERLNKALADLQTRQLAVGNEMGIQDEAAAR
jgi:hypothetical protein